MDGSLDEALRLLPVWVRAGSAALFCLSSFAGAGLAGLFIGWCAARSARRTRDGHWTERARALWPWRRASPAVFLVVLAVHWIHVPAFEGPAGVGTFVLGIAALVGSYAGASLTSYRFVRRERFPGLPLRRWLRWSASAIVVLYPVYPLVALLFLLSWQAWTPLVLGSAAVIAVLYLLATCGLGIFVARPLGLAREDERLDRLVGEASRASGVPVRGAYVFDVGMANAFALVLIGRVGVTQLALDDLDDDELVAVLQHELGHLTEPATTKAVRLVAPLLLLALGSWHFLFASAGLDALLVVLVVFLVLVFAVVRPAARRAERRADDEAVEHTADAATYMRGLEKLSRANLAPAVLTGGTHPSLFDRMEAAGVTPGYERPAPPPPLAGATICIVVAVLPTFVALELLARASYVYGDRPSTLVAMTLTGGSWRQLSSLGKASIDAGEIERGLVFQRAAGAWERESPYPTLELANTLATLGRCAEAREALAESVRRAGSWSDDVLAPGLEATRVFVAGCDD